MDLALNNLKRLICHKTQQTKPRISSEYIHKIALLKEDREKEKNVVELLNLVKFCLLLCLSF